MAIEIKAPTYPESVQEGSIATWHKKAGDTVARDELVVDIETDKVVLGGCSCCQWNPNPSAKK